MALVGSSDTLLRGKWSSLTFLIALLSPTALLFVLLVDPNLDPRLPAPAFHFQIVTMIAGICALLAAVMLLAAERLQEPRGFFLALAFGSIAGFFFIHGFLTPGVIFEEASHGIHWAPLVGFTLAGLCLMWSMARPRQGREPWTHRRRRAIALGLLAVWSAYLILSVEVPQFLLGHSPTAALVIKSWRPQTHISHESTHKDFSDELLSQWRGTDRTSGAQMEEVSGAYGELQGHPWTSATLTIATAVLMVRAIRHYVHQYRLSQLQSHLAVVWGITFFLQSLVAFFLASVWRVSWWQYHVLSLLGVSTIVYGLAVDYRRGISIQKALSALLAQGAVRTIEESYTEVLTGLTAAIEARDPYTKGHSEKVARLAASIGERMSLTPETVRGLYQAGLLHDIGKMAIPDHILRKEGKLTLEEFELVKGHPARSEEIVARMPSLRPLRWTVRWHHERLDGSGYPDGLKGAQIPLTARILAVADVYDAMTSGRAYRSAIPMEEVLLWMEQHSSIYFDSGCLKVLRQVIGLIQEPDRPIQFMHQSPQRRSPN